MKRSRTSSPEHLAALQVASARRFSQEIHKDPPKVATSGRHFYPREGAGLRAHDGGRPEVQDRPTYARAPGIDPAADGQRNEAPANDSGEVRTLPGASVGASAVHHDNPRASAGSRYQTPREGRGLPAGPCSPRLRPAGGPIPHFNEEGARSGPVGNHRRGDYQLPATTRGGAGGAPPYKGTVRGHTPAPRFRGES